MHCENPDCNCIYCARRYLYGDIVLCHICYLRIPIKKRVIAIITKKNQGIEELAKYREEAQ